MQGIGDKYEMWGTFSVMDHLKPGAFLSEVILYDKLVIPVPPDSEEAGNDEEHGFAVEQWDRWVRMGWHPERQQELLKILDPVVERVAWDLQHHEEWQRQYNEWLGMSPTDRTDRLGKMMAGWVSGNVLLDELPAKAAGAVAVCPFDSIGDLKDQLGITEKSNLHDRTQDDLPADLISTVVGREFLVPSDPDRDEFYLLREAVDLVQEVDYRTRRTAYHSAQLRFIDHGQSDYDSLRSALEEMDTCLTAIAEVARSRRARTALRHGFFFTQLGADLVPGGGTLVRGVNAAINVGKYTTSNILQNPADPNRRGIGGALLVDAQRELDLTLEGERRSQRFRNLRRRWRRRRRARI